MMLQRSICMLAISAMFNVVNAQHSQDQVTKRSFFERGKINGNFGYVTGRVSDFEKGPDGSLDFAQPTTRMRSSLAFNFGVNLFERVYLRTTLYYNLNKSINAPWLIPDYAYVLERAKWDPNSFSYGYTNYQLNQYGDNTKTFIDNLTMGSLYVRYYNRIPPSWIKPLRFDSTASISYSFTLKYAARYQDNDNILHGDLLHGKSVAMFTLRYVFLKNMYVEGSILYYLRPETELLYDPDFTYGFGYNSYTHLSIGFTYGNYSVNKFPWKDQAIKNYGFLDGQFTLMINYSW